MNFKKILKECSSKRGRKVILVLLIAFVIVWSIFIYYVSPSKIIEAIGVNNGYLMVFFASLFGGISILIPFPYYIFVFSFGGGGLNPIVLGIVAGIGLIIGESTSYLVGYHGREILPSKLEKMFSKISNWCKRTKHFILVSLFLFLYGSLVPFPNDLIILPLGLARYPYWKMIIPLGLGNIIFNIILASTGFYGWKLFF